MLFICIIFKFTYYFPSKTKNFRPFASHNNGTLISLFYLLFAVVIHLDFRRVVAHYIRLTHKWIEIIYYRSRVAYTMKYNTILPPPS